MRSLLPTLATLAAFALGACGGGPRAAADWRMVDRTVDRETDQRGEGDADTSGPDGVVDDYDNAQGRLLPGLNGNISAKFPEDGRYEVELDACGSTDFFRTIFHPNDAGHMALGSGLVADAETLGVVSSAR